MLPRPLFATRSVPCGAMVDGVVGEGHLRVEVRAVPPATAKGYSPAKCLEAVTKPKEPGTACRISSPDAVVANGQPQPAVAGPERDVDTRRLRMLRRVCQGL